MAVAFVTHPHCRLHRMGDDHPERPARLDAIEDELHVRGLHDLLVHHRAPRATPEQLLRVHPLEYVEGLADKSPAEGLLHVDPDTWMCPDTFEAALRAAGAGVLATDLVLGGEVTRAFCNVRPPGHHAGRATTMGFCFFNNVAIAARHALERHGLERVAILDFDVHLGNGTEEIFRDDPRVLLCSTYQYPLWPDLDPPSVPGHIVNCALPPGSGAEAFRQAVTDRWVPALDDFAPQLLLVSAGFDAHAADDMAHLRLGAADYGWVTDVACAVALRHAQGRIVSTLEGGYDLRALATSAVAHIERLVMA
ncbi:MAG TPA: histone deacetylase family protein [Steroidobacteraceae bacterium]|nr:histone deacetylase family protein [Steroidobacteraceae bacterium]